MLPHNKTPDKHRCFESAGVAGIEPTLEVLETPVLPLYDTPIKYVRNFVFILRTKSSKKNTLLLYNI